jgi:HD-GYP domain-containing protein (c-di-GMP phosphodiesterase class II)/signal transduction histidine kinase
MPMKSGEFFEKKFSVLKDISNAVVSTDDISAIANLMLDLATSYANAEKGSLMLVNERDELYTIAARGIDVQLIGTCRTKLGEGIAGAVVRNRHAVLVEDIEKDDRFKGTARDHYRTKSFISCPILSRNKPLGVLNVNDRQDDMPFAEDEFILIKTIADRAAIALENAFLMIKLKAKAAELAAMEKKLIDTDIAMTEILTHISHELRTPLNSIKGAIYYLQGFVKPTSTEQREFYNIISDETVKLGSIIENLLDFLKHEDETRIVKKSIVNLRGLIEELSGSKLLGDILARKKLKLKTDINEGTSDIVADKIRLGQFFVNLIDGLSPYLETDDTIEVAVHENDFLKVSLTFPRMMPKAVLSLLFDSGYIFQKKDHPEEGTKLCLARKVVESHRWDLNAENTGGVFLITITIPRGARENTETVIATAMEMFVEFISGLLGLNVCSIMLIDDLTGDLTIRSARGLQDDAIKRTRISPGERIAGWVAREGEPLLIENIEDDNRFKRKNVQKYNTKSLLSIPLKIREKVIGVLNLNNKIDGSAFTVQDLQIASALGERVSHFIERFYANEYREQRFKQFTSSFTSLLDAVKRYQKKKNIYSDLMFRLMDKLGANGEVRKLGLYVSMIYDLGLMSIDESVLKKEKLLPFESRALKVHPYATVSLLDDFEFSADAKKAILHHHERYDGTGYPDRLKGDEIPFVSKVVSVVDSFCAMTAEMPYRKKLTTSEALEEIKEGSGSIYDKKVVDALDDILRPAQEPENRLSLS